MGASYEAMLVTALGFASGDAAARVAAWRQLVDIVGQASDRVEPDLRDRALATIEALTGDVPVAQRRMAAASLAGRLADSAMIALFAHDVPTVAAPILAQLRLDDAAWHALLPTLPGASRNILRNRRDLGGETLRQLARYAAADLTLPPSAITELVASGHGNDSKPSREDGTTQIVDLVERIAQFRQRLPASDPSRPEVERPDRFAFETDDEGTIAWVEGVARAPVVGISLAIAAEPGRTGVDAAAAGAWRRRAPIVPSRLLIIGENEASGDWTIEAAPLFNPYTGRFIGYRGEGRRPRLGERAGGVVAVRTERNARSDSIRQLVHELRTPLNAIQGFAAMIDAQMLGPAAATYRASARMVIDDVDRLVALIDDLDVAARLDANEPLPTAGFVPLAVAAALAIEAHRDASAERGVTILFDAPEYARRDEQPVDRSSTAHRIVSRLLGATIAAAAPGEALALSVHMSSGREALRVARPGALRGIETDDLLDPEFDFEGVAPDASLLGLGFTLRLCGRLATERQGQLLILPDAFELALPVVASQADAIAH